MALRLNGLSGFSPSARTPVPSASENYSVCAKVSRNLSARSELRPRKLRCIRSPRIRIYIRQGGIPAGHEATWPSAQNTRGRCTAFAEARMPGTDDLQRSRFHPPCMRFSFRYYASCARLGADAPIQESKLQEADCEKMADSR